MAGNEKNIIDLTDAFANRSKNVLKGGGGGGTYDGMELRVARLESKMDRVEDRLTSIEVTLARIDAKLDSKVDYKWLTVYVLGIVAVIMRSEIASLFTS